MDEYKVLEIKKGAGKDEIEAAYQLLKERYNPNNYKDGPNREWANKKLQEVEAAYKKLMESAVTDEEQEQAGVVALDETDENKQKNAEGSPKASTSTKIWIGCILLTVVLISAYILLLPYIPGTDSYIERNVEQYVLNGDYNTLKVYIDKHSTEESKSAVVKEIIGMIAKSKTASSIQFLEDLFFSEKRTSKLADNILVSMNTNNLKFANYERLCGRYLNSYISDEMIQQYGIMFRRYDEDTIYNFFFSKTKQEYENGNFDQVRSIVEAFKSLEINDPNGITRLPELLDEISNAENDISEKEEEIVKMQEKIQQTEKDLEIQVNSNNNIITLEAFIAAQIGSGKYEILLPNGDRAILTTFINKYDRQGWTTLNAKKMYDEEVVLKEEYGGFTQKWPVYMEVGTPDEDKVYELEEMIYDYKEELWKMQDEQVTLEEQVDNCKKEVADILNLDSSKILSNIVIHYSIGEDGKIISDYENGTTITMVVGQKLILKKGESYFDDRKLSFDSESINFYGENAIEAIASGTSTLTIIPNEYDWDNAVEYNIIVK